MYMWGVGGVNNQFVYGTIDSSLSCVSMAMAHGATFLCCNRSLLCAYTTSAIQVNVLLISSTHTKLTQAVIGHSTIHSHLAKRGICKLINTLPLQLLNICPQRLKHFTMIAGFVLLPLEMTAVSSVVGALIFCLNNPHNNRLAYYNIFQHYSLFLFRLKL
jgi:hypothetical protein